MTDADPFDLSRFLDAQEGIHDRARAEIAAGAKRTHWMWFVFPQVAGLGRSDMARRYAIAGPAEARAYLAHPVLGPRLAEMHEVLHRHAGTPAATILGPVDAAKLRSSATLFAACPDAPDAFDRTLALFFDGRPCGATRQRIAP
ncbi:DUF1810 domain-containing protein [Palleronia rufa]|uniref:DUF1810 domain-containing protein n=1 Tax=Palleronia rufa TaxID=1530186 RepID=UPI00056CB5E5|nr:DUF1810 domain-containing protein [Palleronia rufa]